MAGRVLLVFGAGGAREIAFAPLTGEDERRATDADALLARLASAGANMVHGTALARLTMGDRDRALAALYRALYGDDIAADTRCGACGARFEIGFDLAELAASRQPDGSAVGDPPAVTVSGSRVRLPLRSDIAGAPEDLPGRLTLSGATPGAHATAEALEAADPTLDFDLAGACPECGIVQTVPFSIAPFLEAALRRDRAFLIREVHLIAAGYRWSLAEILSLSRAERQGFARLLIGEREAVAPLRWAS